MNCELSVHSIRTPAPPIYGQTPQQELFLGNFKCAFVSYRRFRSVYEPLHYLLTRESDAKTTRFTAADRHLLEYGRELQNVYNLSNMAASMDMFIPMELFVLDCTRMKEVCDKII